MDFTKVATVPCRTMQRASVPDQAGYDTPKNGRHTPTPGHEAIRKPDSSRDCKVSVSPGQDTVVEAPPSFENVTAPPTNLMEVATVQCRRMPRYKATVPTEVCVTMRARCARLFPWLFFDRSNDTIDAKPKPVIPPEINSLKSTPSAPNLSTTAAPWSPPQIQKRKRPSISGEVAAKVQKPIINCDVPDRTRIRVRRNPKRPGSAAYERYQKYQNATTKGEYFSLGGKGDWRFDVAKGYIEFLDPAPSCAT